MAHEPIQPSTIHLTPDQQGRVDAIVAEFE
jgi:hypothetical protein